MYFETLDRSSDLTNGALNSSRSLTTEFVFLSQDASVSFVTESCIEVLRTANHLIGNDKYRWAHHIGIPKEIDNSLCGPHQTFVLVGGTHAPWLITPDQLSRIKPAIRNAARVGVIGAGVFVLLAAGVLKTQRAAVHPQFHVSVRESGYLADFAETTTCHHKTLSSAISSVAAIAMLVELIGAREGGYTESALREHLGLVPPAEKTQSKEHWRYKRLAEGNMVVCEALDIMVDHLEDTLTVGQVARIMGVSARRLERSFGDKLSRSPLYVYRDLRLERAHALLEQTALPISEISLACGFSTTALLSKWYRQKFGALPAHTRKAAFIGKCAA